MSWLSLDKGDPFSLLLPSLGGDRDKSSRGSSVGPWEGKVLNIREFDKQKQSFLPMMSSPPLHHAHIRIEGTNSMTYSVTFEGHLMGVIGIGDRITVNGLMRGGNIVASKIINMSTQSVVAKKGWF